MWGAQSSLPRSAGAKLIVLDMGSYEGIVGYIHGHGFLLGRVY